MNKLKCGYETTKEWPEDAYLQGDDEGIVFSCDIEPTSYITAFFEVFPKKPKTFIRGEGKSIKEAEDDAWKKFQKILKCDGHEFKRMNKTNHAICEKCNLFQSDILNSINNCTCCNKEGVYIHSSNQNLHYCIKDFINKFEKEDYFNDQEFMIKKLSYEENNKLKYDYEKYLQTKALLKLNKIDIEDEKSSLDRKSYSHDFIYFNDKILKRAISDIKDCKFTILAMSYLKNSLLFNQPLYLEIFSSFVENKEINQDHLISHINNFINLYDTYFEQKYGKEFNRFIKKIE